MSTDIAESLPKRKFAPAPMIAKGAKGKGPAPKGGGKKEAPKVNLVVVKRRVRLKRDLRREFVRQYMILDIVQEEKILI